MHYLETNKQAVAEELCDVLYWVLLISHDLDVDILSAFESKMKHNEEKYPIKLAKGSSRKYSEY